MPDTGLINLRWAHALIDGLAAAGLKHAVISPGSRSTPLVLACKRHPLIQTQVHLDERGAAFLALGQAKAHGIPSAVIATSGSAPAHWYPAVVEAALSGVPIMLLSADRPPELHGWGGNQTLDQHRLFGVHVRAFHHTGVPEDEDSARRQIRQLGIKAVEKSLWPVPGPVHINLPFREPLVPMADLAEWPESTGAPFPIAHAHAIPDPAQVDRLARRMSGRPGLILCGPAPCPPGLGDTVTRLARRLACPLLADPLSGLRFGPWDKGLLLTRYDAFLRCSEPIKAKGPEWILHLGAIPVSKVLADYMERQGSERYLLAPDGAWPDPNQRAVETLRADPAGFCRALLDKLEQQASGDFLQGLLDAERQTTAITGPDSDQPFEGRLIPELISGLPEGSRLFCSNSLPIRQLDTWSGSADKSLYIYCNRGVSGIDGNIATLIGLASDSERPMVGLLGDLALAHDLNSLTAIGNRHLILIVLNNGGGGIFGQLPQSQLDGFERYWLTPQHLDLEQTARLFGLTYQRVRRQSQFSPALEQGLRTAAAHLIEIVIDQKYSLARHRTYWAARAGRGDP